MLKRGAGAVPGRDASRERAEALARLEARLATVAFPASRDALVVAGSDLAVFTGHDGARWTVADLLEGVPVETFTSPQHVAEVLRLRWEDLGDLFRAPRSPGLDL